MKQNRFLITEDTVTLRRRHRYVFNYTSIFVLIMLKGYTYILECADGSYYAGSTINLEIRLAQHLAGEGANHARKKRPGTMKTNQENT